MSDYQAEKVLEEQAEAIEILKSIEDADQLAVFHYLQGLKAGCKLAQNKLRERGDSLTTL